MRNYHFLPTILSTQLPTQLPNIFSLPTVYTTTYTTTCGYRIRKHCLLFTIGHLTCIFEDCKMCKAGKGYYYMQKADIERRRWVKKDILRLTGWVFLFFFCFTFCVSCHIPTRSSIRSSRTPGHVLRRPRRQRVVLDQGLGGARCPWIPETGVQKYIGCRTRPHGGGSGEGG